MRHHFVAVCIGVAAVPLRVLGAAKPLWRRRPMRQPAAPPRLRRLRGGPEESLLPDLLPDYPFRHWFPAQRMMSVLGLGSGFDPPYLERPDRHRINRD